jgi:hypothetical protein
MVTLKPREGTIYVVSFAGFYKIGRTGNLERRLKNILPTAFPVPPVLEFSLEVPDGPKAERFLHDHYHHKRVHGEWFQLAPDDITEISGILHQIDYYDHLKTRLKRGKPQTSDDLRLGIVRRRTSESGMLPLKYAPTAFQRLRVGRQLIVNTSDLAILRSIERKFKLKLSFMRLNNMEGTYVQKIAD